jgi:hypothetical protein
MADDSDDDGAAPARPPGFDAPDGGGAAWLPLGCCALQKDEETLCSVVAHVAAATTPQPPPPPAALRITALTKGGDAGAALAPLLAARQRAAPHGFASALPPLLLAPAPGAPEAQRACFARLVARLAQLGKAAKCAWSEGAGAGLTAYLLPPDGACARAQLTAAPAPLPCAAPYLVVVLLQNAATAAPQPAAAATAAAPVPPVPSAAAPLPAVLDPAHPPGFDDDDAGGSGGAGGAPAASRDRARSAADEDAASARGSARGRASRRRSRSRSRRRRRSRSRSRERKRGRSRDRGGTRTQRAHSASFGDHAAAEALPLPAFGGPAECDLVAQIWRRLVPRVKSGGWESIAEAADAVGAPFAPTAALLRRNDHLFEATGHMVRARPKVAPPDRVRTRECSPAAAAGAGALQAAAAALLGRTLGHSVSLLEPLASLMARGGEDGRGGCGACTPAALRAALAAAPERFELVRRCLNGNQGIQVYLLAPPPDGGPPVRVAPPPAEAPEDAAYGQRLLAWLTQQARWCCLDEVLAAVPPPAHAGPPKAYLAARVVAAPGVLASAFQCGAFAAQRRGEPPAPPPSMHEQGEMAQRWRALAAAGGGAVELDRRSRSRSRSRSRERKRRRSPERGRSPSRGRSPANARPADAVASASALPLPAVGEPVECDAAARLWRMLAGVKVDGGWARIDDVVGNALGAAAAAACLPPPDRDALRMLLRRNSHLFEEGGAGLVRARRHAAAPAEDVGVLQAVAAAALLSGTARGMLPLDTLASHMAQRARGSKQASVAPEACAPAAVRAALLAAPEQFELVPRCTNGHQSVAVYLLAPPPGGGPPARVALPTAEAPADAAYTARLLAWLQPRKRWCYIEEVIAAVPPPAQATAPKAYVLQRVVTSLDALASAVSGGAVAARHGGELPGPPPGLRQQREMARRWLSMPRSRSRSRELSPEPATRRRSPTRAPRAAAGASGADDAAALLPLPAKGTPAECAALARLWRGLAGRTQRSGWESVGVAAGTVAFEGSFEEFCAMLRRNKHLFDRTNDMVRVRRDLVHAGGECEAAAAGAGALRAAAAAALRQARAPGALTLEELAGRMAQRAKAMQLDRDAAPPPLPPAACTPAAVRAALAAAPAEFELKPRCCEGHRSIGVYLLAAPPGGGPPARVAPLPAEAPADAAFTQRLVAWLVARHRWCAAEEALAAVPPPPEAGTEPLAYLRARVAAAPDAVASTLHCGAIAALFDGEPPGMLPSDLDVRVLAQCWREGR